MERPIVDRDLAAAELAKLSSADAVAEFFTTLGYRTDSRQPLSPEAIGLAGEAAAAIARALESGKPALVEVDVYDRYPASGGAAYGWWDVPIPCYMAERRAQYEREMAGETV